MGHGYGMGTGDGMEGTVSIADLPRRRVASTGPFSWDCSEFGTTPAVCLVFAPSGVAGPACLSALSRILNPGLPAPDDDEEEEEEEDDTASINPSPRSPAVKGPTVHHAMPCHGARQPAPAHLLDRDCRADRAGVPNDWNYSCANYHKLLHPGLCYPGIAM